MPKKDVQKIIVTIGLDGKIKADADGFTGSICEGEVDKILQGLRHKQVQKTSAYWKKPKKEVVIHRN